MKVAENLEAAFAEWEKSEDAKIFNEENIKKIDNHVIVICEQLQRDKPAIGRLAGDELDMLRKILPIIPYVLYKDENGVENFHTVMPYSNSWKLIKNLNAYYYNCAALAKDYGDMALAKKFMQMRHPMVWRFKLAKYPIQPYNEDELSEMFDEYDEAIDELALDQEYALDLMSMKEIRAELAEEAEKKQRGGEAK